MPLTVHLKGGAAPLQLVAPCLLPPLSSIVSVQVSSPRYWARELQLSASTEHGAALRRRVIWVKRKTGNPNPNPNPNPPNQPQPQPQP